MSTWAGRPGPRLLPQSRNRLHRGSANVAVERKTEFVLNHLGSQNGAAVGRFNPRKAFATQLAVAVIGGSGVAANALLLGVEPADQRARAQDGQGPKRQPNRKAGAVIEGRSCRPKHQGSHRNDGVADATSKTALAFCVHDDSCDSMLPLGLSQQIKTSIAQECGIVNCHKHYDISQIAL